MKLRSLFILLLVCLGLGTYLYLGVQKPAEEKDSASYNRLAAGDLDEITSIEIKTRESSFELQKEGKTWFLTKPVKDLASETKIFDFIAALRRFKQSRILFTSEQAKEKKVDLSQYGLTRPRVMITYKEPSLNAPFTIILGDQNPGLSHTYASINHESAVYLASLDLDYLSSQRPEDFREMKLTTVKHENFSEVQLSHAGQNMKFQNENGEWKMTAPFQLPVEHESIRQLAEKISLIRANTFWDKTLTQAKPDIRLIVGFKEGVSDARVKTGDQRPFGAEMKFWRQKNPKAKANASPNEAYDYFAKGDKTPWAQISQFHYDNLAKRPEDFVKKTFDHLVVSDVQSVTVKVPSKPELLIESVPNAGWKVKSAGKEKPVNSEVIEGLLKSLRSLRALRFLEKANPPRIYSLQLLLKTKDGQETPFTFDLKKDGAALYTILANQSLKYLVSSDIVKVASWSWEALTAEKPAQASSESTKSEGNPKKEE